MTSTELIACKLFGWEACETPPIETHPNVRWYQQADIYDEWEYVGFRAELNEICGTIGRTNDWPDLTDWNCIRRMEDALAEWGLWPQYCHELCRGRWVLITDAVTDVGELVGRATADQRVAASVKVLEGQG